ncbi:enoyl-CoA hydratase [Deltaproteobacteria bacterium Smac51]|nr:enoyl-CoA hydratase [Deltaproteobacteria bacterium Smac51]
MNKTYSYDELNVGAEESLSLEITDAVVRQYADLIGDTNPVHLDDEYAAKSFFKKRIAHGMLAGGLISAILGTRMPGPGSIYLSQNFEFKRPVNIGETITAKVKVMEKHDRHKKVEFRTWVENPAGQVVLDGTAVVLVR